MLRLRPGRYDLATDVINEGVYQWMDRPRKERIGVQAGTFQSLTVPDQLPVAKISLLGANRTCDIGRSSPICEPRLAYFWANY